MRWWAAHLAVPRVVALVELALTVGAGWFVLTGTRAAWLAQFGVQTDAVTVLLLLVAFRRSLAIGAFEQLEYEQETLALQSGDVLVAFTDGVTEAMNTAGEEFDEARLQTVMPGRRWC